MVVTLWDGRTIVSGAGAALACVHAWQVACTIPLSRVLPLGGRLRLIITQGVGCVKFRHSNGFRQSYPQVC